MTQHLWVFLLLTMLPATHTAIAQARNFTVGGEKGWNFPVPLNYSTWASAQNSTLGDYLVFNSAKPAYNVIRTFNKTVFETCDYLDGADGDFDEYGEAGKTTVVVILLGQPGPNYYFAGVNDSTLCKDGMKFGMNVAFGDGLPPDLAHPPPPPPPSPPPPSADHLPPTTHNPNHAARTRPHLIIFLQVAALFLIGLSTLLPT